MTSPVDLPQESRGAARLLDQLRRRLDLAHELALAVQRQLGRSDVAAIEAATARLQSTVEEFKVLFEELERLLPSMDREAARHPRMLLAREEFEATLSRVARSSAVAGGLLVRIVAITRGRLGVLSTVADGTYLSTGESSPLRPRGVRLKEWV